MYRIKVVGAGQLGSRHLQALQGVRSPLEIHVIDPSPASLEIAKERFNAVSKNSPHIATFSTELDETGPTDIAIVATNADVRREAIELLLDASSVKYFILEKLLFVNVEDYFAIGNKFSAEHSRAWVNCPMRIMPVYEKIAIEFKNKPIFYRVTGSNFGLVTNAIHYLDHVVFLTGCSEFKLDATGLNKTPIQSKRAGFLELNGTMVAKFADGSRCEVTSYSNGNAPVVVEIFSDSSRYIVRESEGKLWFSNSDSGWVWLEDAATIPFQSQITTGVVESLLSTGQCGLATYSTSAQIHLSLLNPLIEMVRLSSSEISNYPFT